MGDTSASGDRRIIDPRPGKALARRAAGEQFAAAITDALATGFATSLAQQLARLTLNDGPWLLHRDGSVTDPQGHIAALTAVSSELYRLLLGEYDTADDEDWKAAAVVVLDTAHDLLWPGGDT